MLLSLTVGDWGNISLLTFFLSYLPVVVVDFRGVKAAISTCCMGASSTVSSRR